ncbi:Uncharacterised protein [Serratia marcescens]|uniref:hypothetical protein n=1 Tax=Serratia marcescens TaxID=615 RepID=UPI0021784774|nr:hypothetical protein [Serratia marcescens]CAI1825691.1 Uncharacterised protein [Serratia marcescens]
MYYPVKHTMVHIKNHEGIMINHLNLSASNVIISIFNTVLIIGVTFIVAHAIMIVQALSTQIYYKRIIETTSKTGGLEKDDLYIFLNSKRISYKELDRVLRKVAESLLRGEKNEAALQNIRGLIRWFEEQEGFIEIPENIRKNLESIKQQTPESEYLVNILAMSLKDIYRTQAVKEAGQRRVNHIYGIIGVVGAILTITQLFH